MAFYNKLIEAAYLTFWQIMSRRGECKYCRCGKDRSVGEDSGHVNMGGATLLET